MGVPDVILAAEDVLAGELLHVLDLEVIPGLLAQILLDLPPFVRWRLHDLKHASSALTNGPAHRLLLVSVASVSGDDADVELRGAQRPRERPEQ
jgi:hypothetical protein